MKRMKKRLTSKTRISVQLRRRIAQKAGFQCGYCRCSTLLTGVPLEIDHIIPEAAGGISEESNLWLACVMCNKIKGIQTHARDPVTGKQVRLYNPRTQRWQDNFEWSRDGLEIIGKTRCGRATVKALQLNRPYAVVARRNWISADLHPLKEKL